MLRIADHWHGSDLGLQRQGNEDNYFVRAPLFVVADGMGGAQSGEVASEMAVEAFGPGIPDGDSPAAGLVRIIETANQRIHERSRSESQRAGMGTTVTAASFTVDLTSITTNESRRDDKVQSALDTGDYPEATFVLTSPLDLGDGATSGEAVEVSATGDLTIHGVTTSVALPIQAKLVDDTIVLVGSTEISFSDYGVDVPSSPVVLSVSDQGTVEVQLLLVKA